MAIAPSLLAALADAGHSVAVVTAKDKLRRLLGHGMQAIVEITLDRQGDEEQQEGHQPAEEADRAVHDRADEVAEAAGQRDGRRREGVPARHVVPLRGGRRGQAGHQEQGQHQEQGHDPR